MRKTLFAVGAVFFLAIIAQICGVSFAAPFPPGVGGTGTSGIPASGTVLIGNGVGSYTPAFLTPGSNVTIVNGSGTVTISAAGSGGITISPVSGASTTFSIIGDGTFFSVTNPSGNTIEVQPATTSIGIWANHGLYLIAANNLSDLTNSSTARTNLGLGTAALQNAGFFLVAGNNLSDLTSTSSARSNIGYSGVANQITISGTGAIGFATTSISQFVNDKGYLTSAAATTTLIAGGTATGPAITIATSTASQKFNVNCTASTCTITIPPFSDYLASSTVYVSSVNGSSGAVTITSSSLGVVPFILTNINGTATTTFNIVPGAGITSTVSGATTTFILNIGAGCSGNNFVSTISPTGTITCATPSGGASSTNVSGINGVTVNQVGTNATASLNTSYAASWSALETFLNGITVNGTTTLASTTNALVFANGSGTLSAYAGSNPCSTGQAAVSISGAGILGCLNVVTSTAGNWQGTWQGVNSTTFYLASNPTGFVTSTVTIATSTASGAWNVTSSGNKAFTITLPSNVGFFTNDAHYISSSTANGLYFQIANNLSESANTSTLRNNIGFTFAAGNKLSVATTAAGLTTYSLTTSSISQFANDAGYVTSTSGGSGGLTSSTPWNMNALTFVSGNSAIQSAPALIYNTSTGYLGFGSTSTFSIGIDSQGRLGFFVGTSTEGMNMDSSQDLGVNGTANLGNGIIFYPTASFPPNANYAAMQQITGGDFLLRSASSNLPFQFQNDLGTLNAFTINPANGVITLYTPTSSLLETDSSGNIIGIATNTYYLASNPSNYVSTSTADQRYIQGQGNGSNGDCAKWSSSSSITDAGAPCGAGGSTSGTILGAPQYAIAYYSAAPTGTTITGSSTLTFTPGAGTSTLLIGTSSKPMCFMGIDTVNSSTYDVEKWVNGILYTIPSSTCM